MRGWLAADIGGTKLAVAAFDGKRLYSRQEMPTAPHRGADYWLIWFTCSRKVLLKRESLNSKELA